MRKSTQAMLILGALAGIAMQGNSFPTEPRELRIEPGHRNRSERRAEERKAAAEAKRARKAAKRAAQAKEGAE